MSLKSTSELVKTISNLEDTVDTLQTEVTKLIQKAYISALQEHTSMSQEAIYKAWLIHNASEDNLEV